MVRRSRHRLLPAVAVATVALVGAPAGAPLAAQAPNTLPPAEAAEGFRLAFDGRSLAGWRGWKQASGAKRWRVEDGAIARWDDPAPCGPSCDLVFEKPLGDFELRLEWKVAPRGNSGIMWHASETTDFPWQGAPEMQVLDDAAHPDGRDRLTSAGANYALHPAPAGVVKAAGEWNAVRLVVRGTHVEHWLNGQQIVAYELGSADWKARVAKSKFSSMPLYGTFPRGLLVLQDHGDRVWYRSIRIKEGA